MHVADAPHGQSETDPHDAPAPAPTEAPRPLTHREAFDIIFAPRLASDALPGRPGSPAGDEDPAATDDEAAPGGVA